MSADLYIFNLINGFAGRWEWLDYLGIICAKYAGYALLLILFIFLVLNYKKYWEMAVLSLAAGAISRFFVGEIIRFLWFRPRPFVVENIIPLLDKSPAEASFPSGHALFYFAVSSAIYFYNKKAGIFFYIVSFLIAVSRVFVGIHWPTDILAGAILGILTAWIINKIYKKYENRIFGGGRGV